MSEMRDRNLSVGVSVVMLLCAALRSVSAVHFSSAVSFWIAFDETSMERFVGVENATGAPGGSLRTRPRGDRRRRRRTAGRL